MLMFSSVFGMMITCSKSSDYANVIGLFFILKYAYVVAPNFNVVESIELNLDSLLKDEAIA